MSKTTDLFEAVALVKAIAKANGGHAYVQVYFEEPGDIVEAPVQAKTEEPEAEEAEEKVEKKKPAPKKRTPAKKKKPEPEPEPEPEEEDKDEEEDEDEEEITIDILTKKVLAAAKEHGKPAIKELLEEFSVGKLTELDEDDYAQFNERLDEECPA